MDNTPSDSSDKESSERRNSNSEWLPTKCRITKPPPPKPATNPLQFVKVAPSALLQKAQEQIKKVEEIKTQRHTVKEDAEEWQQNLDNWKSSRRKRQEHIIERVVEVKKLEQEGYDRSRRRSKTFNEILEDRNKRGHRLNIPIFDDDSNDLSDYGIGSSSSKTNSVKDVDTDDSSSCLDDKDPGINTSDSQSGKDASSASNQSQSEDELLSSTNRLIDTENRPKPNIYNKTDNYPITIYTNTSNKQSSANPPFDTCIKHETPFDTVIKRVEYKPEDYTYQRAIEEYRSKVLPTSLVNEHDGLLSVTFDKESTHPIVHIETCTPQHLFLEKTKPVEVIEFIPSKRLPDDFANSLSVKERLKNLEKCADLQIKHVEKNTQGNSVKSIIKSLTKQGDNDIKNNNFDSSTTSNSKLPNRLVKIRDINDVSLFLVDNSSSICQNTTDEFHRSASPEVDAYMNKLNQLNKEIDSYLPKSFSPQISFSECSAHTTAPPSVSSTELTGLSSDSGIHTADVSCSVSQADESVEYNDILSSTIPNCIEKLQKERERELTQQAVRISSKLREKNECGKKFEQKTHLEDYVVNSKFLIQSTAAFLYNIRLHTSNDYESKENCKLVPVIKDKITDSCLLQKDVPFSSDPIAQYKIQYESKSKPVIYENVDIKNYTGFLDEAFVTSTFPLAPPKTREPPKEKPPPPPLEEGEKPKPSNAKRLNSAKRIKQEMHIKRSSFLGLDERTDDLIEPVIPIETPPDITTFLQKEAQLEKSLYQKYHDSRETSSEVESQDSGLESERGRLSSDTWCSSLGDSNTSTHGRQDSEQTNNSVTSEEDEIAKKEREIIALVEREEKSKSSRQYSTSKATSLTCCNMIQNGTRNEEFKVPYFPKKSSTLSIQGTDQDSEVLRVERELVEVEKEEMERQKENMLLRKNRCSLENICDDPETFSGYCKDVSCRKSMLELPIDLLSQNYNKDQSMKQNASHYYKSVSHAHHRKSMPDIQQAYLRSIDFNDVQNELLLPREHRKSMPELQKTAVSASSPPFTSFNRQPVMAGKPLTSLIKEQRDKTKVTMAPSLFESDTVLYQNIKPGLPITRPALNALSAVPKHRNIPNDNWIQPKTNGDKQKSYNKHWLYQEAELRRLREQTTNAPKWNYQPIKPEKHIPEPIIQTLTQRVQNLTMNERNHRHRRSENSSNQETPHPPTYPNRPHTVGHASPISYPPLENSEGKILSVSGKKKCSFCGNELGRGAAMIIESLCLFYHMDCFKCCVCHIQLGDGLIGTDVRVRNQKLHCHNCYTSDDGVKFSCV